MFSAPVGDLNFLLVYTFENTLLCNPSPPEFPSREEIGSPFITLLSCDILAHGLIGLIGYSYQQGIPSFPEAHLKEPRG